MHTLPRKRTTFGRGRLILFTSPEAGLAIRRPYIPRLDKFTGLFLIRVKKHPLKVQGAGVEQNPTTHHPLNRGLSAFTSLFRGISHPTPVAAASGDFRCSSMSLDRFLCSSVAHLLHTDQILVASYMNSVLATGEPSPLLPSWRPHLRLPPPPRGARKIPS